MRWHTDSFSFKRVYRDNIILVTALYIPPLETWGLTCLVNGECVDQYQTTDPWEDARNMVDSALLNIAPNNPEVTAPEPVSFTVFEVTNGD